MGDAEEAHADPLTHRGRPIVGHMRHRPDLVQAGRERSSEHRARRLGGKALAPAVRVKVPTDLDLAVPVRKPLEDDRPHRNAAKAIDYGPAAEAWIRGELGEVPCDPISRFISVQRGRGREPLDDLGSPVHLDEPVGFIRAPGSNDQALRLGHERRVATGTGAGGGQPAILKLWIRLASVQPFASHRGATMLACQ